MERQEFYRPLPYSVTYKGRKYDLTPAYDNVLTMFKDVEGVPMHRVPEIMGYYLRLRTRACCRPYPSCYSRQPKPRTKRAWTLYRMGR